MLHFYYSTKICCSVKFVLIIRNVKILFKRGTRVLLYFRVAGVHAVQNARCSILRAAKSVLFLPVAFYPCSLQFPVLELCLTF